MTGGNTDGRVWIQTGFYIRGYNARLFKKFANTKNATESEYGDLIEDLVIIGLYHIFHDGDDWHIKII
jgi:hypothetical protein